MFDNILHTVKSWLDRWQRRRHHARGRTSRWTSPPWSSAACLRTSTACPQWRVTAREIPLPPSLRLLALPDCSVYSLPGSELLRLPACAGFTDACGNWLAFSGDEGYFLRNPFSNATVKLPGRFRVLARHRGEQPVGETGVTWKEMENTIKRQGQTLFKTLFCSPQLVPTFSRFRGNVHIAVCQPGAAAWWSEYVHGFSPFVDIAFHQGKLYVLEPFQDARFAININVDQETGDPWVSRVRQVIKGMRGSMVISRGEDVILKIAYLVASNAALLMVVHRKKYAKIRERTATAVPTGVNEFEVFKADIERSQWTKVTTIGDDQVLFLRRRCSRILCVSQMDMQGDRIIFFENDKSLNCCGVYDMKDGMVSMAPPMCSWKRGLVPATWLFPED
ncbi:hypothetical protein QOZ80_9AG0688360 [Eleusine coracana subsp. coracana]|nr:hypothetical protein QOZ80_9AG0688360 [Eleusine coracana subsp. coracana]